MGPVGSVRWKRRLLRHYVPLVVFSAVTVAALYCTRPYPDVIMRWSFSTAYPAMALLCFTLLTGPWNLLRRRGNPATAHPVSSDLRRDAGICAGILCIVHTAVGQCVHLRGRPWLYYIYGPQEHHHGLRHDLFGFANYTGAACILAALLLLATSNDYSLRRMGARQWKTLQRFNYAVIALAAAHAAGYFAIEKQKLPFVAATVIAVAVVGVMQFWGFLLRRRVLVRA